MNKKPHEQSSFKQRPLRTKQLVLTALFTALTAIGAFLNIPTATVPFSLQFLFCSYAGILLGPKWGLVSQLLYIAIGLAGLPIFTKGGGIGYMFQPSFGFILGFALCAYITGLIVHSAKRPSVLRIGIGAVTGLLATYLVGVPYLYLIINHLAEPGKGVSILATINLGVTPFLIFDLIKCAIVTITTAKILPALRNQQQF
ncbi:MAG TPA: biotin transporter BioY [Bacillota bacterium]|nr:biotin transporter BioY [Bacillota bacterium]